MNSADAAFLAFLDQWYQKLPTLPVQNAFSSPEHAAILSVDVTQGFCNAGALYSPRVAKIVAPIASLMQSAWDLGVRQFLLSQDTHEPDAVEFAQWPAHCVRGTDEAETVTAIKALPFFDQITLLTKNSISSDLDTGLSDWLRARPQVNTFVVVGDCTDLCTYQLAMHLRLSANARQLNRRVIVPENCVDTYDFSLENARAVGAFPHPGELTHRFFLYHMAMNGVEVVKSIR